MATRLRGLSRIRRDLSVLSERCNSIYPVIFDALYRRTNRQVLSNGRVRIIYIGECAMPISSHVARHSYEILSNNNGFHTPNKCAT